MRTMLLRTTCLGLMVCLYLEAENEDVRLRLRLIDAQTGQGRSGIIRVFRQGSEQPLPLPGLFDRLLDRLHRPRSDFVGGWYVVPTAGAETTLPRASLRLEALSGLETAMTRQDFDLRAGKSGELTVPLQGFFYPEQTGLVAGNTHLHLYGLSMEECNEYLRQIPAGDGLKVLFTSYATRTKDDANYVTNRYSIGDQKQFAATGVLVNHGEEHRNDLSLDGSIQGYGHVMLLNIKRLIQPVSIGPAIMVTGKDEPSLSVGIVEARRQGGTVIWCHNAYGHEDIPNALAGRLDALNVFDGGGRVGTFEDTYYVYLNSGLRLPLSTGTDWFIYDFSRVYAKVSGKLTIPSWLDALKAGRSVATNGPLLTLTVDGHEIGDTVQLDKPKKLRVEATALGRQDFRHVQLVQNGKVVATQAAGKKDGSYATRLTGEFPVDRPGWFAVRIESQTKNELGQPLFAHSSPVYVELRGQQPFDVEAARELIRQLEESQVTIRTRGQFSSPQAAAKVLALYEEAARKLRSRMKKR